MQTTPLVLHAAMRVPALTPLFSDALAVTSMTVTPNAFVVLTTAAPHGVQNGGAIAVAITDAGTPNPITAAALQPDGNILLTTGFEHDFSGAPDGFDGASWDSFVRLQGFDSPLINGSRQLVGAPSRGTLLVRPGGPIGSVTLGPDAAVIERLPGSVIGWHAATATGPTTLRFATGQDVLREMTVDAPVVVRNIRVWGAIDFKTAESKFVSSDGQMSSGACHLFVVPAAQVKASRSRNTKTDALAEVSAATDLRQMILDGFTVLVFVPAKGSSGAIAAADLCHGPLFRVVLRTFLGLNLPRPELMQGSVYAAVFAEHGTFSAGGAFYVHAYRFEAPAVIADTDGLAPFEQADLKRWLESSPSPGFPPPTDIVPVGAPAFRDLDLTGILHDGCPQPLTGTIALET